MKQNPKIVIFGSGAIGCTLAGWIGQHYDNLWLLSRGEALKNIRENGIQLYQGKEQNNRQRIKIKAIEKLSEIPDVDVVVLTVKNYSLEKVCRQIKEEIGDKAIVLGLQNGLVNQLILPEYFSKPIFGVVGYNAWIDQPGTVGYQEKGSVVLGTPDNSYLQEMQLIASAFDQGIDTSVTKNYQDAAHTKLVINLTNSITTLIGTEADKISSLPLYQKIIANLLYEGIQIIRAAGYSEHKIKGIPPWWILKAAAKLPYFLTAGLFRKNLKKMVMSSMAQDIIKRNSEMTELEDINGYLLKLAEKNHVHAPYNRVVYRLCQEYFGKAEFKTLDVRDVWKRIQKAL